ncbi:hypothetical protein [Georgenia yuyongxinii]|uniref:PD-(D/E)XK nuclease superfamily protein n=1 Tax=Georgenia yuyongxinii TaxID=2589797 RepID=A0A552WMD6_9MICO|nr:hypothetical protein [Georgenia yuyongxinii]TRW43938.1 hypothetical protein FJ693_15740 [Georgenia yuyongxinii]
MFVLDGEAVLEPGDLARAADCEWAVRHEVEARLAGLRARTAGDDGATEAWSAAPRHAGSPGAAPDHTGDVLAALHGAFGRAGVCELPAPRDGEALRAHHDATLAALRPGIEAVHGGGFFDGRFHGRIDLLIRDDGVWVAHEVPPPGRSRHESSLRLAACYDGLTRAGVAVATEARLLLQNGTATSLELNTVVPVYRTWRARLETLVDERRHRTATGAPAAVRRCGRCPACQPATSMGGGFTP